MRQNTIVNKDNDGLTHKGELGNGAQRVIVRTKIFQISRVFQSAQPVMHSAMRWLNCWRDHWCQWFAYDRREIDLSIF